MIACFTPFFSPCISPSSHPAIYPSILFVMHGSSSYLNLPVRFSAPRRGRRHHQLRDLRGGILTAHCTCLRISVPPAVRKLVSWCFEHRDLHQPSAEITGIIPSLTWSDVPLIVSVFACVFQCPLQRSPASSAARSAWWSSRQWWPSCAGASRLAVRATSGTRTSSGR